MVQQRAHSIIKKILFLFFCKFVFVSFLEYKYNLIHNLLDQNFIYTIYDILISIYFLTRFSKFLGL